MHPPTIRLACCCLDILIYAYICIYVDMYPRAECRHQMACEAIFVGMG